MKEMNNFEVYGTLNVDVSLKDIVAENSNEAIMKAEQVLNSLNIAEMMITTISGEKVKIRLNDFEMNWERAFGEGE